jgi:transmembrane sensor
MTFQKVLPAAAALSLSLAAVFAGDATSAGYFESPIGQQRTVPLPDGSTITLNTNSSIRVWGTQTLLHVDLLKGEALFDMKPNPDRHLTVSASDIELVDQGTIFDVRLVTNGTARVTVQEGSVQLSANGGAKVSLRANQQMTVNYAPTVATLRTRNISPESIQHQFSWRRGVLDFDCVRLADAIDEINRYNSLQMEIVGPIAGDDRISGAGFSPTDPTLFARTAAALIPNLTWQLAQRHPSQTSALLQLHQSSPPSSADSAHHRCTPQDPQSDDSL